MILRLTAQLGRKVGALPTARLPLDENPFADWSGHLFRAERVQYVIVANTPSLYSVLMYGRGMTDDNRLLTRALANMREFMGDDGNGVLFDRFIGPTTGRITFSKALNRSVTGSLNDLVRLAKYELVERELSPYEASFVLNETPMSFLGYAHPRHAFRAMASGQHAGPDA